jgi:hypothetical protein
MQLVEKVKVTRGQHLPIYRRRVASQVSLFVGFLIFVDQPTHEIGTPRIKVISEYASFWEVILLLTKGFHEVNDIVF